MNYELPESFYSEKRRRSLNLGRLRFWSILAILFCALNLFTDYGLIRRNRISPEFPNSEFGIQKAFVNADGELVLERSGYVDRLRKYSYGDDWDLHGVLEYDIYTGIRLDSNPNISNQYRTSGLVLDIKPGDLTLEKIRRSSQRLRGGRQPDPATVTTPPDGPGGTADIRSLKELPAAGVAIDNLRLSFVSEERPSFELLQGHQYLPYKDSHCYTDPLLGKGFTDNVLYITTDNKRFLHRIQLNPDQLGPNWVSRDRSVPIPLDLEPRYDSHLCHHPTEAKLMLISSDGRISWFDDHSLALLDSHVLPGNWEREYASLFQSTGFYSEDFGIPLTKLQSMRIYRALAALLLIGMILLAAGYLPAGPGDTEEQQEETGPGDESGDEDGISIADLRL